MVGKNRLSSPVPRWALQDLGSFAASVARVPQRVASGPQQPVFLVPKQGHRL